MLPFALRCVCTTLRSNASAGNWGCRRSIDFPQRGVDGWYAGIDPDDSAQFMCKNLPPGGYNYSRYCSPEMDAAQTIALTHYDQATRKAAYAKTQALLARDVPEIFINWLRQMHPINSDCKGLDPSPVIENWNAWQWSI